MAQKDPRPFPHGVAIGFAGTQNRTVKEASTEEQLGELGRVRPIQCINRIAMVGIAKLKGDKEQPTLSQEVEAVPR